MLVGDVVDGEQFHRRHPELDEVRDGRIGCEPGVRAAEVLPDAGVPAVKPFTWTS